MFGLSDCARTALTRSRFPRTCSTEFLVMPRASGLACAATTGTAQAPSDSLCRIAKPVQHQGVIGSGKQGCRVHPIPGRAAVLAATVSTTCLKMVQGRASRSHFRKPRQAVKLGARTGKAANDLRPLSASTGGAIEPQAARICSSALRRATPGLAAALCVALTPLDAARALPLEVLKRLQAGQMSSDFAQAPPEIRKPSSARALKIGGALAERKAIMFGTFWCPYCDRERQALGQDVWRDQVRYVECDPRGVGARPDLCEAAGVQGFPTWAVASQSAAPGTPPFSLFQGAKGLNGLEQLVGLASAPLAVPPPVTGRSGAREIAVSKALASSGALFYGSSWCPACDAQRQLFGAEAWAAVPYVECDARSVEAEPSKCQAVGVESVPLWVFRDGTRKNGVLTMAQLEERVQSTKCATLPIPTAVEKCDECKVRGRIARESKHFEVRWQ